MSIGEVIIYHLSPEEINRRYGHIKGAGIKISHSLTSEEATNIRKKEKMNYGNIVAVIKSNKAKITDLQLIEEIKKGGFNLRNYSRIAREYGYKDGGSVSALISYHNIKFKIKAGAAD